MNQEILQSYLVEKNTACSLETIKRYRSTLNQFFSLIKKNYHEIQTNDIRVWIAYMRNQELTHSTIQKKFTVLRSFYNYCEEKNEVLRNPTDRIIIQNLDNPVPHCLSELEIANLRLLVKDNSRDHALFELLYGTGIRINELLDIKMKDINFVKQQIRIPKAKRIKERIVILPNNCLESLIMYLKGCDVGSVYLFCQPDGEPLTREAIDFLIFRFTVKLEIAVSPFTLRYTFAAHKAKMDVPFEHIHEQLGHDSKKSERFYLRIMNDAKKNASIAKKRREKEVWENTG